jgi:glycosyltransferase involved in cell wall biosynthesis
MLETLPLKRSIARSIEGNLSGLVFVSDDLRRRFQRVLGRGLRCPYWVLPMGVTAPRPCPDSRRAYRALVQDRFCIVTVGRLTSIKGYDLLAKAIGELSERARKEIYWLTAGAGPERSALEQLAQKLEINQRSLGHLAPPQRDALLSIADLFVAPSRQIGARVEGAPVALREALTSGCSIIATQSGGVTQELNAFKSALSPDLHGEVISILPERVDQLKGALERFYTRWRATQDLEETSITRDHLSKIQLSLTLSDEAKRRWLWTSLGPQHARALECSLL